MYRLGLPRTAMAASFDFIVVSKTKSVVISDGWQGQLQCNPVGLKDLCKLNFNCYNNECGLV